MSSSQDYPRTPLPLIISSPSGAGKSTLTRRLLAELGNVRFSVSHTTRKPRVGEQSGREYHFVDRDEFWRMVDEDAFLEWAEVHGNLYGTHQCEIADHAKVRGVIFDIDHQGARQIKSHRPDAVLVFVLPPSMKVLEERLRGRASEDEETVRRRFAVAKQEIAHYGLFDYVIVNDDLEAATTRLLSIFRAEECKRTRAATLAEELLVDDRANRGA